MYEKPTQKTNFDDVGDFHTKFGLESVTDLGPYPREVDAELLKFRLRFMFEELLEFCDAVNAKVVPLFGVGGTVVLGFDVQQVNFPIDLEKAFDALIDKVYIDMGTAHLFGFPWQQGWDRVQTANMSKVRSESTDNEGQRGSSWDVIKPPGWVAPDLSGLLTELGFEL